MKKLRIKKHRIELRAVPDYHDVFGVAVRYRVQYRKSRDGLSWLERLFNEWNDVKVNCMGSLHPLTIQKPNSLALYKDMLATTDDILKYEREQEELSRIWKGILEEKKKESNKIFY